MWPPISTEEQASDSSGFNRLQIFCFSNYRYAAYKVAVHLLFIKKLGKGRRKPLPSCLGNIKHAELHDLSKISYYCFQWKKFIESSRVRMVNMLALNTSQYNLTVVAWLLIFIFSEA